MIIDFKDIACATVPNLNGGNGEICAKMYFGKAFKAIESVIPAGASIGMHKHAASIDFNYVVSGEGVAVCDGKEEILCAGSIHYCPVGSEHSIINTGTANLVLITFVPEIK